LDFAKTTKLAHFTTAASNVALYGNYMAALFASAEGGISTQVREASQQTQTTLTHPLTG
jgi:hypothetical protein